MTYAHEGLETQLDLTTLAPSTASKCAFHQGAYLPHVFSKLDVMHLYEVNVLELHPFQGLVHTLGDTICTEVCWLPSSILPNLCSNYDLIPR